MPSIPQYYQIFFLWIEPITTLLGAVAAAFFGHDYLVMTHAQTTPSKILGLPIATDVALRQLGNLYLAFAINEFFVLRSTNDLKVWRAVLLTLLVADFGHLLACFPAGGFSQYYDVTKWNAMSYGNLLFVYIGATLRSCFLAGVGLGSRKGRRGAPRKSIKHTVEDEFAEVATPSPKELSRTPAQSTRRRKNRSVSGA
ncbi:uncharacterized protein HMPREF1541_00362 [Cyphellophora europaea CBS 101466]|uniref:DUF7704 domain-containing protein n=1 Tax=Cyphellophora europaea (strain CBS 101466) TaxID=1220924 RepID=W2SDR2_CYPE1|nr:uncharacterized protein HMPREF1541_00362 [Cyphellophora europaea CBS 101466]ETN46178.1 hypothetical protein HMPREF1541_00362 [Cyphellophora europaea CBS 101466]